MGHRLATAVAEYNEIPRMHLACLVNYVTPDKQVLFLFPAVLRELIVCCLRQSIYKREKRETERVNFGVVSSSSWSNSTCNSETKRSSREFEVHKVEQKGADKPANP